ncbi:MAG: hypothetical protein OIF47_14985 [Marinibacterium sp.]|nr:hypothetical protein [Marinibacterium sp.]
MRYLTLAVIATGIALCAPATRAAQAGPEGTVWHSAGVGSAGPTLQRLAALGGHKGVPGMSGRGVLHPAACSYQRYWVPQCRQSCWNDRVYQGGTWVTVRRCQNVGCWQTRRVCN